MAPLTSTLDDPNTGLSTSSDATGAGGRSMAALPDQNGVKPLQQTGLGLLLTLPPAKAAEKLHAMWKSQDKPWRSLGERWKVNRWRREGYIGVALMPDHPDKGGWTAWAPPGGQVIPPVQNKMARLLRRVQANVFVDEPVPECTPGEGDGDDPDRAEFATRALQFIGSEAGVRDVDTAKMAFDVASCHGSGFRWFYVDPRGNGHRPMEIPQAHPDATHESNAPFDPATGLPPADDSVYVSRFVRPDGSLTDQQGEAAYEWLPKLKCTVLDGRQVRPIPETAVDIWDARGAMVATYKAWGELKACYADAIGKLADDEIKKMIAWRPDHPRDFLPAYLNRIKGLDQDASTTTSDTDEIPDDALVFCLTCYMVQGDGYPRGAYVVVGGNDTMLYRGPWETKARGRRDIPLDQFKQLSEGTQLFYGYGLADPLGNENELLAMLVSGMIEHLDRFNRRRVFIPLDSSLTEKILNAATGGIVPVSRGGEPKTEEVPEFPAIIEKMYEWVIGDMDDESSLQAVAQALQTPEVRSGLHAQTVIEQTGVNLSGIKQNTEKGLLRGWRIQLQEVREEYTTEQQMKFVGDDGDFKFEAFAGADLASMIDVRISKGSFTMLSPSAKMAIAEHLLSLNLLSPMDMRQIFRGDVGGLLGVQDDPHYLRIKKALARWLKGPTPADDAAIQQTTAAIQQAQATPPPVAVQPPAVPAAVAPAAPQQPSGPPNRGAPAHAQQQPQQPAAPPPPTPEQLAAQQAAAQQQAIQAAEQQAMLALTATVFDPRPNDREPSIAMQRCYEISRVMSGDRYKKMPPIWQHVLDTEYGRCSSFLVPQQQPAVPGMPPAQSPPPQSLAPVAAQAPSQLR